MATELTVGEIGNCLNDLDLFKKHYYIIRYITANPGSTYKDLSAAIYATGNKNAKERVYTPAVKAGLFNSDTSEDKDAPLDVNEKAMNRILKNIALIIGTVTTVPTADTESVGTAAGAPAGEQAAVNDDMAEALAKKDRIISDKDKKISELEDQIVALNDTVKKTEAKADAYHEQNVRLDVQLGDTRRELASIKAGGNTPMTELKALWKEVYDTLYNKPVVFGQLSGAAMIDNKKQDIYSDIVLPLYLPDNTPPFFVKDGTPVEVASELEKEVGEETKGVFDKLLSIIRADKSNTELVEQSKKYTPTPREAKKKQVIKALLLDSTKSDVAKITEYTVLREVPEQTFRLIKSAVDHGVNAGTLITLMEQSEETFEPHIVEEYFATFTSENRKAIMREVAAKLLRGDWVIKDGDEYYRCVPLTAFAHLEEMVDLMALGNHPDGTTIGGTVAQARSNGTSSATDMSAMAEPSEQPDMKEPDNDTEDYGYSGYQDYSEEMPPEDPEAPDWGMDEPDEPDNAPEGDDDDAYDETGYEDSDTLPFG